MNCKTTVTKQPIKYSFNPNKVDVNGYDSNVLAGYVLEEVLGR